jgi:aryl-alcohol dehydrogenase-like predicted oxidoreductase
MISIDLGFIVADPGGYHVAEGDHWLDNIEIGVGAWAWGDRWFWGFGGGYVERDVREAFDACLNAGVRLIDTAETYGQGESERLVGKFIGSVSERFYIASKFMPFPWRLGRGVLKRALKNSLERLKLEKVDLYQIHWPIPPVPVETWMDRMVEVHQAGLVDAVGVSNYDRNQTQRAFEELTRQGLKLASNQVEYHLLDRRIEKSGLLKQCQDMGVRIIAYSPLAQGLLTGKYSAQVPPRGVRGSRTPKSVLDKLGGLIAQMRKIGVGHGDRTPAQVALNWVICKGALPIPGAKNQAQAVQNAGALGWRLTEEEIEFLDETADRVSS